MRSQYSEQLIGRAERDPEFRKRLIADPKAAVKEELGVDLPGDLDVRVVQEQPTEAVLVLPVVSESGALREEELAGAAGGTGGSWCGHTYCSLECSCSIGP